MSKSDINTLLMLWAVFWIATAIRSYESHSPLGVVLSVWFAILGTVANVLLLVL